MMKRDWTRTGQQQYLRWSANSGRWIPFALLFLAASVVSVLLVTRDPGGNKVQVTVSANAEPPSDTVQNRPDGEISETGAGVQPGTDSPTKTTTRQATDEFDDLGTPEADPKDMPDQTLEEVAE